jgi:hypothetical protein
MQQNFLSPTGFRFVVKRLPNVSFYVQSASIPGMSMGFTPSPTPFKTLKFAGDKLNHDAFTVTIRVDEYMESYNEIYNWMVALTKNESYSQFAALESGEYGIYSDASLIVLNSRQNPALEVYYKDVFPVSISDIRFDTTQSSINYVTCDITFEHNGHTVKRISG